MVMIRVFLATETDFTTNGEKIIKPISAIITKTEEEEYIEVEAPLEYADFLLQENILIVDTLVGKKGYRIHNPVTSTAITVKAWLIYQETVTVPADRGAVIAHGKNLENCEVSETWDDVVTKLIPIGYNGAKLPEGYLAVTSPYQKVYEKTLEFDLTESLEDEVEALEDEIETNEAIESGLKSSIITLQAKYNSYDTSISSLQGEITTLQQRLSQLGTSEPEKKEKATIEAQMPLIENDITQLGIDKTNTLTVLDKSKADLIVAQTNLTTSKTNYNNIVQTDLRTQAQTYLNVNQYPRINYDLEAHLEGIIELGDTVKVKHPDMRVDLLTNVTSIMWDCLTARFTEIQFGTAQTTLKGKLAEIDEKVEEVKETTKKTANTVSKYYSEYKRDNEELVSKFTEEIYGLTDGIYGMMQKNQSMFRQTASEITGTVSRVNANLSSQVASLSITAAAITAKVEENYTALDGKITENASQITQTATSIRSEVSATLRSYSTTTQMNSAINQSASSITSTVNVTINGVKTEISQVEQTANKINWLVKSGSSSADFTLTDRAISLVAANINLTGYVKITDLAGTGSVEIDAGNIKAGGTITGNRFTNGNVTIDDTNITIDGSSGYILGKSGYSTTKLIGFVGGNVYIGQTNFMSGASIFMNQQYIKIGYPGSYGSEISFGGSRIGFYGASAVSRQTVDKVYSASVSLSNLATRFNTLIAALNTTGLINGSSSS